MLLLQCATYNRCESILLSLYTKYILLIFFVQLFYLLNRCWGLATFAGCIIGAKSRRPPHQPMQTHIETE